MGEPFRTRELKEQTQIFLTHKHKNSKTKAARISKDSDRSKRYAGVDSTNEPERTGERNVQAVSTLLRTKGRAT